MKFSIDFQLQIGDNYEVFTSEQLKKDIETHRATLGTPRDYLGELVMHMDDKASDTDYADPLVRIMSSWLQKLTWVIGGDTETVALRNSEECYVFVRTGSGVEISFYAGTESEIEDYIVEPFTIGLEQFFKESVAVANKILALVTQVDEALLSSDEDCLELISTLSETKKAWHDFEIHQNR